jgi:hypothetical protein
MWRTTLSPSGAMSIQHHAIPLAAAVAVVFKSPAEGVPEKWTTLANELLVKSPNPAAVLNELVYRLYPRGGWMGSLAATLESRLTLLNQLDIEGARDVVPAWETAKQALERRIVAERCAEAEAQHSLIHRDRDFDPSKSFSISRSFTPETTRFRPRGGRNLGPTWAQDRLNRRNTQVSQIRSASRQLLDLESATSRMRLSTPSTASSGVEVPAVRPTTFPASNHSGRTSASVCTRCTRAQ